MGDLKIGEYYRTKKGLIRKINTIHTPETRGVSYRKSKVLLVNGRHSLDDIESHSYDIMNLIKVGDYVNGCKVKQINCKLEYINDDSDTGVDEIDNGLEIDGYPTWIYFSSEIENIVTKEQFESVMYKK